MHSSCHFALAVSFNSSNFMAFRTKRPIKFRSLFKEEAAQKDIQVSRDACFGWERSAKEVCVE